MKKLDLAGAWQLSQDGGKPIPGRLPGCTYLDYMANGMPDPFWGENETTAKELARHDYTYARDFELDPAFLDAPYVELVASGLDTLCTLTVNNMEIGKTDNIHRTWRYDVKDILRAGTNTVSIFIANPYPYMAACNAREKLIGMNGDAKGATYLRKVPCHFGWDWGPVLPPSGLLGFIGLEAYSGRIVEVRYTQKHAEGEVTLDVEARLTLPVGGDAVYELTAPDMRTWSCGLTADADGIARGSVNINEPSLWWPNGLGGQPLYTAVVTLKRDGVVLDTCSRQLGLRTVALDTAVDELGRQFRFVVNGVPIFAKGANWIPADSFITRVKREDYAFYIESAKHSGINMLRVWGGGMYECDDFYDLCDENGILVWQDFIFACGAYPFYEEDFLNNVRREVEDNIRRLRHHASLALWCGNNESEALSLLWRRNKRVYQSNREFYHITLRDWVNELDSVTPYWPGSPSSGRLNERAHILKPGRISGDTHLWQVWHGMEPIEAFRKYPTRFCSEFGMESMPSLHTVRLFCDNASPGLFDAVMKLHQKSKGGNEKILFYMLAKYRNPALFEDFIYLSQLVQANTVRFATDCWRRNIGRQNGALFWQYNDCWPVASWAGIDYGKQYKAVQYHARHFNKMICLSNDYYSDRAELYVINETAGSFSGMLEWTLRDFTGKVYGSGRESAELGCVASKRVAVLRYSKICKGVTKDKAVLTVVLKRGSETVDQKNWLLVPDKKAALPAVKCEVQCAVDNGIATVTLTSDAYARYLCLEADGVTAPWSDNFFDLTAGESYAVTVRIPDGMDTAALRKALRVRTLADVRAKNSAWKDRLLRLAMVLKENNWITWLLFKILM